MDETTPQTTPMTMPVEPQPPQLPMIAEQKLPALSLPLSISLFAVAMIALGIFWPYHPSPAVTGERSEKQAAAAVIAIGEPELLAKAVIVYDVRTGKVLYEKNSNAQLPLASLTKLMLVLTAVEALSYDAAVTITPEMLDTEGDTGFSVGEQWSLTDLIDATLVSSSNDAASALAYAVGNGSLPDAVAHMNKNARTLGLHSMYFLNPTGLDESITVSGAYGSALDIAKLFSQLVMRHGEALNGTSYTDVYLASREGSLVHVENTNGALGGIPGFIAGKTGFTDLAGGNLAVAFDIEPGHPIVIVVLGSTKDGRFTDVEVLSRATRNAFK